MRILIAVALTSALLLGLSCEPQGTEASSFAGTQQAGVVRGKIRYEGARSGKLRVAVFSSFPPRGAPIAVKELPDAPFPQAYEVQGVPPGRFFVLAIVDTDSTDGDKFRPSVDPGGAFGGFTSPTGVNVDAAMGAQQIDIELAEPSVTSPYLRNGYR